MPITIDGVSFLRAIANRYEDSDDQEIAVQFAADFLIHGDVYSIIAEMIDARIDYAKTDGDVS